MPDRWVELDFYGVKVPFKATGATQEEHLRQAKQFIDRVVTFSEPLRPSSKYARQIKIVKDDIKAGRQSQVYVEMVRRRAQTIADEMSRRKANDEINPPRRAVPVTQSVREAMLGRKAPVSTVKPGQRRTPVAFDKSDPTYAANLERPQVQWADPMIIVWVLASVTVGRSALRIMRAAWPAEPKASKAAGPGNGPGNGGNRSDEGRPHRANATGPPHWATVLGVREGCSPEEARTAFRNLVSQYLPDKVSHLGPELQRVAAEKILEINSAWEAYRAQAEA